MMPPTDSTPPSSPKADWERARDTHATAFPENLRNWLELDPYWRRRTAGVIGIAQWLIDTGKLPLPAEVPASWDVLPLDASEVDAAWEIDRPVVSRPLPPRHDWLLLAREADRLTVMTLDNDGHLMRVFWDLALGGDPTATLVGCPA